MKNIEDVGFDKNEHGINFVKFLDFLLVLNNQKRNKDISKIIIAYYSLYASHLEQDITPK